MHVPDACGKASEVCLGYDVLEPYLDWTTNPYFGAVPRPSGGGWTGAEVAGRCANRIKGGKFRLDGKAYQLATNNGTSAVLKG